MTTNIFFVTNAISAYYISIESYRHDGVADLLTRGQISGKVVQRNDDGLFEISDREVAIAGPFNTVCQIMLADLNRKQPGDEPGEKRTVN